jgi:branched-chain amino acid transport system permease protein
MNYLYYLLIVASIYAILTISLNIIVGFAGILSIAHAAFYALGGYVSGILVLNYGIPFIFAFLISISVCAILGSVTGLPAIRLQKDYFLMLTLGFCAITQEVLINWRSVTGGADGMPGIPKPAIFTVLFDSGLSFLGLVLIFLVLTAYLSFSLENSPFGRILKAIREDEDAAKSLGVGPTKFKLKVLAIGAGLAGMAGSLYAHYMSVISPSSSSLTESILIFCMLILGGLGNMWGSIFGAFILVFLPQILRFLGFPTNEAANVRQILYGLVLLIMMRYRPMGLMGKFKFWQTKS